MKGAEGDENTQAAEGMEELRNSVSSRRAYRAVNRRGNGQWDSCSTTHFI